MNTNRTATRIGARITALSSLVAIALLLPASAMAHCDGMDGPVVKAAQKALANGDVNLALIWVQKDDEKEIRQAFERTLAVRKLSRDAEELADKYFFETLVRIHRAGEGAPYTGLKPAGRDLGPAIPLADQVLTTGKLEPLLQLIGDETRKGLLERFDRAVRARHYAATDVGAGREYVRAYVGFIHYVERVHEAAMQSAAGHFPESTHLEQRESGEKTTARGVQTNGPAKGLSPLNPGDRQ
jgi:uncharacterized protein DUF6448